MSPRTANETFGQQTSGQTPHDLHLDLISQALDLVETQLNFDPKKRVDVNGDGDPWKHWWLHHVLTEARKCISAQKVFNSSAQTSIDGQSFTRKHAFRRMCHDTLTAHSRKLKEILARLIVFAGCNADLYYHLYVLSEEISLKRRFIRNLNETHGTSGLVLPSQLKTLEDSFKRVRSLIGQPTIPFLKSNSDEICSEKTFLTNALKVATDAEKMELGYSYNSYSLDSGRLHANFGVTVTTDYDRNDVLMTVQSVILSRIALKLVKLLDVAGTDAILKLQSVADHKLIHSPSERRLATLHIGEVVEAHGCFGEVIETRMLLYPSYRVRFFKNSPLESIKEDLIPGIFVHPIGSKRSVAKLIQKRLKKLVPRKNFSLGEIERNISSIFSDLEIKSLENKKIMALAHDEARNHVLSVFSNNNVIGTSLLRRLFG